MSPRAARNGRRLSMEARFPMSEATWQAGVGVVDITPDKPIGMAGYYFERISEGTHDPLCARAIVFSDGKSSAALVNVDLVGLDAAAVADIRAQIEERRGLPPERVMIAATHTHTGPLLADEPEYLAWLKPRIADSVVAAMDDLAECQVRVGRAELRGVSFVRRYRMKDGSVRTNPGLLNPEVEAPLGDMDPELKTLRVLRDGQPRAALVNFALHCDTVGGNLVSAGWPFYMGQAMRPEVGDAPVFMFQGCSGDINHWNVFQGGHLKGFDEAERIGAIVGQAAREALAADQELAPGPVAASSRVVALAKPPVSDEEYAAARAAMAEAYDSDEDFVMARVIARKRVRVREWPAEAVDAEVQAVRVGGAAFVGVPCELFNALGRGIKAASPLPHTWVCELANGCVGYVAAEHNHDEGGYETASSIVAPGAGEALRDAAVGLLNDLAKP